MLVKEVLLDAGIVLGEISAYMTDARTSNNKIRGACSTVHFFTVRKALNFNKFIQQVGNNAEYLCAWFADVPM